MKLHDSMVAKELRWGCGLDQSPVPQGTRGKLNLQSPHQKYIHAAESLLRHAEAQKGETSERFRRALSSPLDCGVTGHNGGGWCMTEHAARWFGEAARVSSGDHRAASLTALGRSPLIFDVRRCRHCSGEGSRDKRSSRRRMYLLPLIYLLGRISTIHNAALDLTQTSLTRLPCNQS